MMRQAHGVPRARRLGMIDSSDTQTVLVVDALDEVLLSLSACAYPAGLTPDQADFIAEQLAAAATRVRETTRIRNAAPVKTKEPS